ncbi:hypothetical protein PENSPDRAFT_85681 [Peniophora sp. CONT]|nr:hypothetical protein PENSPDRAFT_85681 [Peniophora sp. CONT]
MAATPTIVATEGAHPLLYASLVPISPLTKVPRIDLYKPKALYSVGRNPRSDIPLVSQCIDWSLCTLQWDGRDEVRIVDLFSANGIWINRRRLTPGGSRVLQDGDTVFFSLCRLRDAPRHGENPPRLRYEVGENYAYTYHQYTDRSPPLSSIDQSAWTRLNELESSHRRIEEELEKLRREREDVLKERQSLRSACTPVVRAFRCRKTVAQDIRQLGGYPGATRPLCCFACGLSRTLSSEY